MPILSLRVDRQPTFDRPRGKTAIAGFPSLTRRNSSKIDISLFSSIVKEENGFCVVSFRNFSIKATTFLHLSGVVP